MKTMRKMKLMEKMEVRVVESLPSSRSNNKSFPPFSRRPNNGIGGRIVELEVE